MRSGAPEGLQAQRKPSGMGRAWGLLTLQLCLLPLDPRPAPLFPAGLLTMRTFPALGVPARLAVYPPATSPPGVSSTAEYAYMFGCIAKRV